MSSWPGLQRRGALALVLALVALLPGAAQAQTVTRTRSLDFGRFAANNGGAISIDTNGARSQAGSVILLPQATGASAAFTVSDPAPANAAKAYVISLPEDGTVTLSNGTSSMSLSHFVSYPDTAGTLVAGSQTITIGATLSVAPGQAPGNYSGSFAVTINYQ